MTIDEITCPGCQEQCCISNIIRFAPPAIRCTSHYKVVERMSVLPDRSGLRGDDITRANAIIWMLYLAHSHVIFCVRSFSPPFADAYAETVLRPYTLIIEHMLMILPLRRSIIFGATLFDTIRGATRSTSITCL